MRKLSTVALALVVLLSIAAALPKLLGSSQEVAFFENVGLPEIALPVFGLLQLVGGLLLIFKTTRVWGAAAAGILFLASALMVFWSGNAAFGLVSLLPAVMAGFVLKGSASRVPDGTLGQAGGGRGGGRYSK